MTDLQVVQGPNCDNSPKNRLVADLCIDHVRKGLAGYPGPWTTLMIHTVISHGKGGFCEFGLMGPDSASYHGGLAIEFRTAAARQVARITAYERRDMD